MDASMRQELSDSLADVRTHGAKLDALNEKVDQLQVLSMALPYLMCVSYNLPVPEGLKERIEAATGFVLPDAPNP